MPDQSPTDEWILKLGRNRVLAHQTLFKHRHPSVTPPFHYDIINLWHSSLSRVLVMAFREAGKSTLAEESFVIGAAFKLFHNAIIIGSTEKRATERLRSIKHELEHNEMLHGLFGPLFAGPVWNEAEVILANGVRIIAVGRGQSLRGTKHLHYRPDFAFCDDIEDREHVVTPDARLQSRAWFIEDLLPALDHEARIRVNATPLDRDALPMHIAKWPGWRSYTFPIERISTDPSTLGQREALWPQRYPLAKIDEIKQTFAAAGNLMGYAREYLCIAEDPATKIFTADMFASVVKPRTHTWEPVYAFYDPARTTNKKTSATTGWAVWSYTGGTRLTVWEAGADFWQPDQLTAHIFEIADRYQPVAIGVEQDGLHEFLMQPLRAEQLRRGVLLPLKAMKAPKGKLDFIAALQNGFRAGDISFAKPLDELTNQFLNYPTGRIDAPNALAYSALMKPGVVVYEDFGVSNVNDALAARARLPIHLCINAGSGYTTAVAVQVVGTALHVLWDDIAEGDPGAALAGLVVAAKLRFDAVTLVAPPHHWRTNDTLGLRAAVGHLPAELRRGADQGGREELRRLLRAQVKQEPAFQVSPAARWTLNALSCGYARAIDKRGQISELPEPGVYQILMEGLESFTGLMKIASVEESPLNYQTTAGGQRYVSALPNKQPVGPAKDDWSSDPASAALISALPKR